MKTLIIHYKVSRRDAPEPIDLSALRRDISISLDNALADVRGDKWVGGRTNGEKFEIACVVKEPGRGIDHVRSALGKFRVGSLRIERRERLAA